MLQRNVDATAVATTIRPEVAFLALGAIVTTTARIWQQGEWPRTICEATAWATAVLGVLFAHDMRQRFEWMLERLFQRGTIDLTEESIANLRQRIGIAAERGATVCGLLLPAILMTAYVWLKLSVGPLNLVIWCFEALAAYIVGRYVGRGIVYGFVGSFLKRQDATLVVKPSHPDGAAGLKPAGEFYTYQAMLLMIPTAFFAVWWLVMHLWIPDAGLATWQHWYLGFFFLAIACELAAFVLPVLYFYQEMKKTKQELLTVSDEIADRIVNVKEQLKDEPATNRIRVLEDELVGLNQQFEGIEDLPTWPFDHSLRRRMTLGNVTLMVPILIGNLGKVKEGLINLLSI